MAESEEIKELKKELDIPEDEMVDPNKADMDLPDRQIVELMAQLRAGHVADYHRKDWNAKANRAVGNKSQADALDKETAYHRMAVALIDMKYPAAKDKMKEMLK